MTTELQQSERTAIDRAVQIKEEYGVRIADLERQVAQKTSELQARGEAQPELEQNLRRELDRLIRETQEKNQILQDRNDELVRVKAEADGLQERFSQVEAAREPDRSRCCTSEGERMRDGVPSADCPASGGAQPKGMGASGTSVRRRARDRINSARNIETSAPKFGGNRNTR